MSQKQVFILVEGHEFERYVYSRIASVACTPALMTYQVISARELPGKTGGKPRLLRFYRFARRFTGFILKLGSRKRALVFYLDKDVDDICQRREQSSHICYTSSYDLEGDIILVCDLINVIGVALSTDPQEIPKRLGDTDLLLHRLAEKWIDWTSICLYTRARRLRAPSYGSPSLINKPLNGPIDPTELASHLNRLHNLSGLSRADFLADFSGVKRLVRRCYGRQLQNVVFKGKWYFTLLDAELRQHFVGAECNLQQLPARLGAALMSSLDYSGEWASRFKESICRVIEVLASQSHH